MLEMLTTLKRETELLNRKTALITSIAEAVRDINPDFEGCLIAERDLLPELKKYAEFLGLSVRDSPTDDATFFTYRFK